MAKRIIWTLEAAKERRDILEFWIKKTGNKNYSKKLAVEFRETIKYIAKNNYMGRATDEKEIRVTICGNYLLFYEFTHEVIKMVCIWDSRRNPEKSRIKY